MTTTSKTFFASLLFLLLTSCGSSLFYTKNRTEHIDMKVLEQYAAQPEESPYSRSTQYGNKDQSTVSYILTSRKTDSIKIVVWKKNGVYTNITKIDARKGHSTVTRYDATGKLVERKPIKPKE